MADPNDLHLVFALDTIKDEVVSGCDNVVDVSVGCCKGLGCDRKPNLVEVMVRGWRPLDTHSEAAAVAGESLASAGLDGGSVDRQKIATIGFREPDGNLIAQRFEARRILGLASLVEPDRVADDL